MHPFCRIKRLCRSCSWCVRVSIICFVFLLWLTLRPHRHQATSFEGLDVWLDHEEAKKILGVDGPYFFIQDDKPIPFSTNAKSRHLSTRSRLQMSRGMRFLNISFSAPTGYYYLIDDVTISNPLLIGHPVFSIPTSGRVPSKKTVFSVELPCSGRESGLASVSFRLHFQADDYDRRAIKASPILFQIEKQCAKSTVCHPPCWKQGGACTPEGKCDCKEGYYGMRCERVICHPRCYNGGTCSAPGVCSCLPGFSGKFCHLASCQDNCFNHGRCIAPGKCRCYKNWTGDICQNSVNDLSNPKNVSRRIVPDTDDSLHDLYDDPAGGQISNDSFE